MNRLARRIARLIEAAGPISIADYMELCLLDPQDGYYTTHDPFGAEGDFVTAPEISQMFGELVGAWLVGEWQAIGRPMPVTIAEIGPGRGTMMKDIIRTVGKLEPALHAGARFALVEASPRLADVQRTTLRHTGVPLCWHRSVDELPAMPLLVAGNEIFDALPFQQFAIAGGRWRERSVGLDDEGHFRVVLGLASLAADALPHDARNLSEGSIFEIAPARARLMAQIATQLITRGGAGIFFDYGHLRPGLGDTFQAVRKHTSEGIFDNPGEADLTSHVDFSALAAVAQTAGLDVRFSTQAEFLLESGLLERAGQLGASASEVVRARISAEVERLAGPDAMGELFKVLRIGTARAPGDFVETF